MAPITRSSVHGSRGQPFPTAQLAEQEELESEHSASADEQSDFLSDPEDDGVPFQTSTQEMLRPLQDTANRVSRQVEEFAKRLDQFNNTQRGHEDQKLWEEAWQLLEHYSNIAKTRRNHTDSRAPRSSFNRKSLGDTEAQIQKIGLEADIWILIKNLLMCDCPESVIRVRTAQYQEFQELNRYSSNSQIWNSFLDSDIVGQEYECCLDWLQERAAQSTKSVKDIVEDLQHKSNRGDNPWEASLLCTARAIKEQKTKRAWPMPLDPSNPGLSQMLRSKFDNTAIVTQLDPDSQTRESADLVEDDDYLEQSAWQACWELLRRGQPFKAVHQWLAERNDTWRMSLIRVSGTSRDQKTNSPWLRIVNLAKNAEFIDRCKALCQNDQIRDKYQTAIYGLLCGDVSATQRVCNTIDDHLFSIFNALLIERFQQYVTQYRQKLNDPSLTIYKPEPGFSNLIEQYVSIAQTDDKSKAEAHDPHKYIEMAILARDFEKFFIQTGQAAAQVAHSNGEFPHLMEQDSSTPRNDCAQIIAQDEDSVRIVAHLQLMLQSLGLLNNAYERDISVMENNVANYIGWLQKHKKWTLVPLYASKLSQVRAAHVLGAILIDITNPKERETQVRLMKHYKIDVSEVVHGIFSLANYNDIERFKNTSFKFAASRITELVGTGKVKLTKIRSSFMEDGLTNEAKTAISSVEWYQYVGPEHWGKACWSFSFLYKLYLYEGRFSALKELKTCANLRQTSLKALGVNLQFADEFADLSENGDVSMNGTEADSAPPLTPAKKRREPKEMHPLARRGTGREALYLKSQTWLQLEQLVTALDAFERFQDYADNVEANRSNLAHIRSLKPEIQKALDQVKEAMAPFFDREFLSQPLDEAEIVVLEEIRNHYVPECILAYNSVLYFAGHALSRTWLLQCMELAQIVAQNPMLTNAFVKSGRMRELVSAFALDSQALLQANEQGGSKSKKGKKDSAMEIWQVSWKNQGPVDLQGLD